MSELQNAINSLGFPKTAAKHIFSQEDEEEQLARAMTITAGIAALLETHFVSFYEQIALRSEMKFLADNFVKTQRAKGAVETEEDGSDPVSAISEALREMVEVVINRNRKTIEKGSERLGVPAENRTVLLMKPAVVAHSMAIALLTQLDTDELKKLRESQDPPDALLKVIRTTLDKAYLCPADDATKSLIAMHAKTQTLRAIEFILQRRAQKD